MRLTKENKLDPYVAALIKERRAGHSLPQAFYSDIDVYQNELAHVFDKIWMLAGHVSQLRDTGQYFLTEVAGESIIVSRGTDDKVRAFYNVCRHRGSRICIKKHGKARLFVCPYHAWSYNLDGSLRTAPLMSGDFDKSQMGLHACHTKVFEGLIFINLAKDDPIDFDPALRKIKPYIALQKLANAKVIDETIISTKANWKLVVENFWECYHCKPSHPEFAKIHGDDWLLAMGAGLSSTSSKSALASYQPKMTAFETRAKSLGHPVGGFSNIGIDAGEFYQVVRTPLASGCHSETRDGKKVAPLMGELSDFDGGMTHVNFNPLVTIYLCNDHAVVTSFRPKGPASTDVHLTWLVDASAREDHDYKTDEVTWMWRLTGLQDKTITENNQLGVNSAHYVPGPYSEMEWQLEDFIQWYFARLQDHHNCDETNLSV